MNGNIDIAAQFPGLLIIHQRLAGLELGEHSHEEHEFFLPMQGAIEVEERGRKVLAGPGQILYVPPDLQHSFRSGMRGSGERLICLVSKKLWQEAGHGEGMPSVLEGNSFAKEILFYLLLNPKAPGAAHFARAAVAALADSLAAAQFTERAASKDLDPRIAKAIALLKKDQAILLSEAAKQSGLSERNFSRLFQKETGLSARDFVVKQKIEKAKRLLAKSKLTVTDVALEVGYNSVSKFIAAFKRLEGQLPSDYRARA